MAAVATVGAFAATMAGSGAPAEADTGYPSWSDIQQAQQNEASKQAEITKLNGLLTTLQQDADAAAQAAGQAGEAYQNAKVLLDAATAREAQLQSQADAASAQARQSKMRAGLIAAKLAQQGAGNLTLELLLNSANASELLQQLSSASQVGKTASAIYAQALADQHTAEALTAQAADAANERQHLADAAQAAYTAAQDAAAKADAAYAEQDAHQQDLYAQLASLQGTTAELEQERAQGLAAAAAAAALAAAQQSSSGSSSSDSSAGPPSSSAVETAIAFAEAQVGDAYELGGMGPDTWDCSGLTKAAYAAAGINIGSHSATNQFYTLANRGLEVSLGNVQRGDLLFWGSGGSYYHVAIYLGNGRILEAPDYGKPVREYFVWGSPSAAARPSG